MSEPKTQDWLSLLLISLIWGSSFILIKKGLAVYNPVEVASFRIFWAMIAMLPFGFKYLKKVKTADLKFIALVGFLGSGIPAILFATAQTKIPSAISGSLNALVPIFTFVWGVLAFGIFFQWRKMLGLLIGLFGAILLVANIDSTNLNSSIIPYALLIIIAGNCYAISANTVKKYCSNIHPLALNLVAFAMLFPFAISYLIYQNSFSSLDNPEAWMPFFYLVLLGVFSTAIANIFFFRIAQRTSALFASTTTYLIPIVALFWGILDDEFIGIFHLLGLALIVSGVYLINRRIPSTS